MVGYEKKRKPPHKKGYTGVLLEPMLPEMASGVGWKSKGADANLERMKALFRHYRIKYQFEDDVPDKLALFAFMNLSQSLAEDHVPGFAYRGETRGRKKKEFDQRGLFWAVKELREKEGSIKKPAKNWSENTNGAITPQQR